VGGPIEPVHFGTEGNNSIVIVVSVNYDPLGVKSEIHVVAKEKGCEVVLGNNILSLVVESLKHALEDVGLISL
jgi:hypothetical protein